MSYENSGRNALLWWCMTQICEHVSIVLTTHSISWISCVRSKPSVAPVYYVVLITHSISLERQLTMLPPAWIMVLLHFRVCRRVHVIPKQAEGSWRLLPTSKGENLEQAQTSWLAPLFPKGKPLGSHMVSWKYMVHPNNPHYDWVDHRW